MREHVTRSHELDCDLEVLSKPDASLGDAATTASTWSQPSGLNPEGKYVRQVSVTTCTPVTGDSELIDRSQVKITTAKILQRERQLNKKTVKPQARREADEHQHPKVAQGDPDDGLIEELLKELDEPHEFFEDDEAMTDALLQELELEIVYPVKDKRIELIAEIEGNESLAKYWGAPNVLVESISEIKGARSLEGSKAEGKCVSKGSHLTGRFERPNSLVPIGVIQQHPKLSHRRRLWVPHRKHCRRKHERLQMSLHGLCWPTHRKHGRWKPEHTMMPPLPLQLRPDGKRCWCRQRKRVEWKSGNRDRGNTCPPDNATINVKLHPPNS